jgi:hypothetical protein
MFVFHRELCRPYLLALVLAFIPGRAVFAQNDLLRGSPDPWSEPAVPRDLRLDWPGACHADSNFAERPSRIQLFRMPAGFICEPAGLDSDDDTATSLEATSPFHQPSPGEDRLQVLLGSDNPFFDFRSRGDPGGAGYYRLNYQYQLVDGKRTGLCLNCRAVTPAGLESGGLAHGPTFISPALAWFQELGNDTALQGFVGKHIHANSRWADTLEQSIQYGVALQRPIPGLPPTPTSSFHMFVEALGRQRNNGDLVDRPPATWQVLPGVHWRWGENWWMSGGVLFPLGGPHPDTGLLQFTCKWRF